MSTEPRAAFGAVMALAAQQFAGGGPFDGQPVPPLSPGVTAWPEFIDLGLGSTFHASPSQLRSRSLRFQPGALSDWRRALYRYEPLADGTVRYVFDRRYNR